ncbi:cadherin repeat domain-containing protein [Aeromonas hydrophila]|uniref:Cadherin repeat domain-containing protein n=1 Tax=Aeromonas hydrophila TaxID=644 RepID=A0A926FNW1_AERHY|nr:cadherin repeat domain-containing protein [Aeromonas hydrophila]
MKPPTSRSSSTSRTWMTTRRRLKAPPTVKQLQLRRTVRQTAYWARSVPKTPTAAVTYSIKSGNDNGWFAIDAKTG